MPRPARAFVEGTLGLAPTESVAGFVHIGTETSAPPERPRPDLILFRMNQDIADLAERRSR